MAGRENSNLEVPGSNPVGSLVLLIRGLFLLFILLIIKLLFCCILGSVCEALPLCKIFRPDFLYFHFFYSA